MIVLQRPPFPRALDNTLLSTFRSCPQKFMREYLQHWKPARQSIHLVAGAAFAQGLEVARTLYYEKGESVQHAMEMGLRALIVSYGTTECPPESSKSLERMCQALEYYFEAFPMPDDPAQPVLMPSGRRAIEFSFVEPLEINHPETNEPLLYSGRSDMIVSCMGGTFIEDDKTTSALGSKWGDTWEMRAQFTGYCWAARRAGLSVDGVLVRGIAILKTLFKHAQHFTYRPQWEIDRWYDQTHRDIARMIQCWKDGLWDYDMGGTCDAYGGCLFLRVCKSPEPEPWLDTYFQKRKWDPVTREETVIVEEM